MNMRKNVLTLSAAQAPEKRRSQVAPRGAVSRTRGAYTLLVVMLLAAPLAQASPESEVPVPDVTGPIPSHLGAANNDYTFFASDLLGSHRYIEEEYFYSGLANVYDATVAGGIGARGTASPTANVVSSGHPYTTRMVVRRPDNPAKFNGNVVVEWLNATGGYDVEALWFRTSEFLMREGYAWVGITAQSGTITNASLGLQAFSPERYGSLDLTAGGTLTSGDHLSYDVYAQGVQAIREAGVLGPLQERIETVVAAGVSQSAGRVSVFANAIQPRGQAVVDAALLYIGGEKIRSDLDMPVFKVLSETEFTDPLRANVLASLQPDTHLMRTWSVTGTSHADWKSFAVRYALVRRDQPTAALQDNCAEPSRSRIPDRYTLSSAMDQLVPWTRRGAAPVTAPQIALTEEDSTVVRDSHGNALGGIRLAPFEVPIAVDTGVNANAPGGGGLCFLNGTHVPFDTETLNALYPDRQAYLQLFDQAVKQNVRDGFLLPEDARELRAAARSSIIGQDLECGPLCANMAQFPIQPSTQLLRDHTAFLYIHGGHRLVDILDDATLAVARGQSSSADRAEFYVQAIEHLEKYQEVLDVQLSLGRVTSEQAALLDEYATVLINELKADI
jgi:hypothetical protein